jgi:outer membrane protein assembly factor BamA
MKLVTGIMIAFLIPDLLSAQIRLELVTVNESKKEYPVILNEVVVDDTLGLYQHLWSIIDSLHFHAYLEASVDSISFESGKARAYLHEGRQYGLVSLSLDQIDDRVLRTLRIRKSRYENDPLTIYQFRELIDRLLSHYENTGYPFAAVSVTDLDINSDTISGNLVIDRRRLYRIDSIFIYGDAPVGNKYMYRHLNISPGDLYSERRFRRTGEKVRQTPFLREIREPEVEFNMESADLYIYAGNQPASSFSGILGIIPGDGNSKTGFAGEINLELLNAFSKMETIRINWQSPGNQVQQADVKIGQPYMFGRAFGADLHLQLFRQDTTYMNVDGEAGIPFSIPGGGTIRVFGKTSGSTIVGEEGRVQAYDAPAAGFRGNILGLSYSHRLTDNILNPYRGWLIEAYAGAGKKTLDHPGARKLPDDSNEKSKTGYAEAVGRLQWFIPVTRNSTIMLSNLSGWKVKFGSEEDNNHFFANELFLLGGLNSIRGFDERSIAASAYSIQKIEYRYLFDAGSNLFLFFDGMAYETRLPGRKVTDLPFGFGGGLTLDTRAGQFTISYAIGKVPANPFSFRSSRIHMGIVNRF